MVYWLDTHTHDKAKRKKGKNDKHQIQSANFLREAGGALAGGGARWRLHVANSLRTPG